MQDRHRRFRPAGVFARRLKRAQNLVHHPGGAQRVLRVGPGAAAAAQLVHDRLDQRLLDMLAKSEDVETLIALEQRLSDVRYEIESIERSLRNYDMQIRYSTVELDLREVEVYTPTVPVRRTFGQKLSDSLSDGWTGFARGVQNVILSLASALPALVLLAVIVIAVIAGIKTARKKRKAKFTAQQEPPQDPKP